MKRIVIGVAVVGLVGSGVGLASAKPTQSNGAQKAGIAEVSGNSLTGCSAAPTTTGNQTATGFAVLNAPGKPGSPRKIVGEVALKSAKPGTYDVNLANGSGCGTKVATLTVNDQGNGSAAIAAPGNGAGTYYVVLTQPAITAELPGTVERYASVAVALR
jgi:hypothetical protein